MTGSGAEVAIIVLIAYFVARDEWRATNKHRFIRAVVAFILAAIGAAIVIVAWNYFV